MKPLPLLFLISFHIAVAAAQSITIPEPLMPWTQWVMERNKAASCITDSVLSGPVCIWGGELVLKVTDSGLSFKQYWTVLSDAYVPLPGGQTCWPYTVFTVHKELPVVYNNSHPSVYLKKGNYTLSGIFRWNRIPASLRLPESTVLISVVINGHKIASPDIDTENILWFGRGDSTTPESALRNEALLTVYRKITDGEPLTITTHLRIEVSGKARELIIGKFLPDNSLPLALKSPLPARIEKDGNLRIQVRPGSHIIELTSRTTGTSDTIRASGQIGPWPKEEIWSFESNNNIRIVKISGGTQIDPSQTTMPSQWRHLPAYYLPAGSPLILTETHRGNWAPLPNELQLQRELWLDFNGKGLTARDKISGTITQSTRLSTEDDCIPGSIEMNGAPQVITISADSTNGIEIKKGPLDMTAVSRYPRFSSTLSLSGWKHAFKGISTTLHLPPGWRILTTIGIHQSYGSWVTSWNLWELFLAFVLVASFVRLAGVKTGIVAAMAFALTFQEPKAPVYSWIIIAGGLALLKASVLIGRKRLLTLVFTLCMLYMAGITLMFTIRSFRQALYPQLEREHIAAGFRESVPEQKVMEMMADELAGIPAKSSSRRMHKKKEQQLMKIKKRYDFQSKIQTGPGIPQWQWNSANLTTSGPVNTSEKMTILLIPPLLTRLLNFISPLSIIFLLYLLIGKSIAKRKNERSSAPFIPWRMLIGAIIPLLLLFPRHVNAAYPSDKLLNELEQRLVASRPCSTSCVALHRGTVLVTDDILTMELTVGAQQRSAFRLPFSKVWHPSQVMLAGGKNALFSRGSTSCLLVPEGVSTIRMKGPLHHDRTVISFPFAVHNLFFKSKDWTVQGLIDGTVPDRSLILDRNVIVPQSAHDNARLLPDPSPVFCTVSRHLDIDIDWHVTTTIERIAPQSGAFSLALPLITGEKIISPNLERHGDSVIVSIPDGVSRVSWKSRLEHTRRITLSAAANELWRERWSVKSTPNWHLEARGFNPVTVTGDPSSSLWYPRPGEALTIVLSRPDALIGQTHTVEQVSLNHTPGQKSSETNLQLVVKSSQGDKIWVHLPCSSQITNVTIDNKETTISRNEDSVALPLSPGNQHVSLSWKSSHGVSLATRTPRPSINEPLSNISCTMRVPKDRWLLYVAGPQLGPAVQFWGILCAMLFLAVILGISKSTPLKTWQWSLLFIGMSTVSNPGALAMVFWFLLLRYKEHHVKALPDSLYNPFQVLVIILGLASLISIIISIPLGLLSTPSMQVGGYESGRYALTWFQDRASGTLFPQGTFISLPLWTYRLVMLAWSLWLAISFPYWIKWAWTILWSNGIWRKKNSSPHTTTDTTP